MIQANSLRMVEAITVIDIDPSLSIYNPQQQKWLTGIQISTQPVRDKKNCKNLNIAPGIYLALTFCQNNKDPIYEIDFMNKIIGQWIHIKGSEFIQKIVGSHLCYKTEPTQHSGPICDIQLLAIQRKSRFGENKDIINVPHGYKLASQQLPIGYLIFRKVKGIIEQTFKPTLAQKYCPSSCSINLSQLPLFCFPDGIKVVKQIRGFATFNFIFTMENGQRIFVTSLIFKQNLDNSRKKKIGLFCQENVFYEKALCIVSKFCYTDQFAQCLQHLYRLSMSKSQIPFYRLIQCFANELILPEKDQIGKIGICYSYSGNLIKFPTTHKIPILSERALYSVFKFLTIDNIINTFQSLLLQKKVFFVSQSKTILGYAIQAFTSFLFPFKWQQVLIPILPSSLKQYLTAPVPLVAGISPQMVDSSLEDDSVIVFLDKNQVLNDQDLPPLPQKLVKQLRKRLQKMEVYDAQEVIEFLENPESTYLFKMQQVQDPHFQTHVVRDIFFQFILTIMKNYRKFINWKKTFNADSSSFEIEGVSTFTDFFKIQNFLNDLGMTKVGSFGYKFTESSIFTAFIQRVCKSQNDKDIEFFDSCIEKKKAKKQMVYIEPIVNEQYRKIKNAQIDQNQKGPFFYEKFPSLTQDIIQQEDIVVQIVEQNCVNVEENLKKFIQEQFYMNSCFFQEADMKSASSQFEHTLSKIYSLLLKSNKKKFQQYIEKLGLQNENRVQIYEYFFNLYINQSVEIDNLFQQWPKIISQVETKKLSKVVYLKKKQYFQNNNQNLSNDKTTYLIYEDNDIHSVIRANTTIQFITSGQILKAVKHIQTIVIEIQSHRLKSFVDSILPKQSSFFIDYIEKQNMLDMRKSAFKKISYKSWTIETLLNFRDWIHYQKQFGTGITTG